MSRLHAVMGQPGTNFNLLPVIKVMENVNLIYKRHNKQKMLTQLYCSSTTEQNNAKCILNWSLNGKMILQEAQLFVTKSQIAVLWIA